MSKASRLAELLAKADAKDLKAGPGLHEAAMDAAKEGRAGDALALLERLRILLDLDQEGLQHMLGQAHRGPEALHAPSVEVDLDRPIVERRASDSPMREARGGLMRYAEGGEAKKKTGKEFMRAVGESLFGAIPFVGEEAALVGGDVGEQMYRKGALPIAGFKSQWWGTNPTTGEYEYAGPGSDAIHGRSRPPYPDEMLLSIDPEEYQRQFEEWKNWEDPGETGPIPGIIDETMALPLLGGMVGAPTPEFAEEAGMRTEDNWQKAFDSQGLEEPEGFVENTLASLGLMAGQAPVPAAWLNRARPAAEATKGVLGRLGRISKAAPRAGIEFLSPIIEPKVANYVAGALFGGTLMTALEPGEVPPDIQELLEKAEGGDREAYEQLKALYEEYEQGEADKAALREYGQSDAVQDAMELLPQGGPMAKGGKVKNLTRRDLLKGLLGAGATVAAGSKAARHTGANQMDEVGAALARLDEGVTAKAAPVSTRSFKWTDIPDSLREKVSEILDTTMEDYLDMPHTASGTAQDVADWTRQAEIGDDLLTNVELDQPFSDEQVDYLEDALDMALDDPDLHDLYDLDHDRITEVLRQVRGPEAHDQIVRENLARMKALEE